jgi:spore germination protein YaaH
MGKRILIFIIVVLCLFVGFRVWQKEDSKIIIQTQNNPTNNSKENNTDQNGNLNKQIFITGWLPYWAKAEGAKSLENNISAFDEIHPFAFGVNPDGTLNDTLKIKNAPWPDLKKEKIDLVPTILWGDAAGMHKVFSDQSLLKNHINSIDKLLVENNFSGVDIDYEGKDVADRDLFSNFIKLLHQKLSGDYKKLNCTKLVLKMTFLLAGPARGRCRGPMITMF